MALYFIARLEQIGSQGLFFLETLEKATHDDAETSHKLCQISVLSKFRLPKGLPLFCDRAIALNPNNHDYYISRGLAYLLLRQDENAAQDFRRAAALARQNGQKVVPELEQWAAQLERGRGAEILAEIFPRDQPEVTLDIWRETFGLGLKLE